MLNWDYNSIGAAGIDRPLILMVDNVDDLNHAAPLLLGPVAGLLAPGADSRLHALLAITRLPLRLPRCVVTGGIAQVLAHVACFCRN